MKFITTTLLAVLAVLPAVSAHGTLSSFKANGKTYTGPEAAEGNPFKQTSTPTRQLLLLEPITDLTSSDNTCGRGTPPKALEVATVAAGSDVSFTMRGGEGGPWPHEYGPVLFYLARCPGTADTCDQSSLKWFKVDQLGLKPGQTNVWYHGDLMEGKALSGTIPAGIESGDYLLRIEVIALHNAMNQGGAETSVSCTQLHVTGDGSAVPAASDLVSFPGAYKATDPGILVDIWNNFKSYTFPGPAVFKASGSGSAPASSSSVPASSSSAPASSSSEPATTTKPTASAPINAAPAPTTNKSTSTSVAPTPTKTTCKRQARHRRARALMNHAREFSPAY